MSNVPLSTIGLVPPRDFPTAPYEAVHARVGGLGHKHPHAWGDYAGGWNGVARRFISCAYYGDTFTASIQRYTHAPSAEERQLQEHALFGFFVAGLAAVESFCYALHAMGSMIKPSHFPISTAEEKRQITPHAVRDKFLSKEGFPQERITSLLQAVLASQEFKQWSDIRNILAHRAAPGRHVRLSVGAPPCLDDLWIQGIPLNADTTRSHRAWLAETMAALLDAADEFTSGHF